MSLLNFLTVVFSCSFSVIFDFWWLFCLFPSYCTKCCIDAGMFCLLRVSFRPMASFLLELWWIRSTDLAFWVSVFSNSSPTSFELFFEICKVCLFPWIVCFDVNVWFFIDLVESIRWWISMFLLLNAFIWVNFCTSLWSLMFSRLPCGTGFSSNTFAKPRIFDEGDLLLRVLFSVLGGLLRGGVYYCWFNWENLAYRLELPSCFLVAFPLPLWSWSER